MLGDNHLERGESEFRATPIGDRIVRITMR